MAMASQEMGAEAMLLNSRKAPAEARHLGEYEVVFATAAGEPSVPADAAAGTNTAGDRLSKDVAELKKELESMRRALTRSAFAAAAPAGASADLFDIYATLAGAEVCPELAREVVQAAEARVAPSRPPLKNASNNRTIAPQPEAFHRALVDELESRFSVEPTLGRNPSQTRIVALVGPPGAGKTTTLVKLAVNYGLACRRPVLLFSVDTYRVAAAEQLRSYAAILGVGFQVFETVTALAQAIEENRSKELIFIDTPGLASPELDAMPGLGRFLSTRPDIDTHLVLPASMKSVDLARVVDSFEIFGAQRLLFTRLDETGSFGPILNQAVRMGRPLSFFANGQRIPEDLEAASRAALVEWILSGQRRQTRGAA